MYGWLIWYIAFISFIHSHSHAYTYEYSVPDCCDLVLSVFCALKHFYLPLVRSLFDKLNHPCKFTISKKKLAIKLKMIRKNVSTPFRSGEAKKKPNHMHTRIDISRIFCTRINCRITFRTQTHSLTHFQRMHNEMVSVCMKFFKTQSFFYLLQRNNILILFSFSFRNLLWFFCRFILKKLEIIFVANVGFIVLTASE